MKGLGINFFAYAISVVFYIIRYYEGKNIRYNLNIGKFKYGRLHSSIGGPNNRSIIEGVSDREIEAFGIRNKRFLGLIQHPSISKDHAYLEIREKNALFLKDMGSLNGTKVNGQRLNKHEEVQLHENDLIEFGHCK